MSGAFALASAREVLASTPGTLTLGGLMRVPLFLAAVLAVAPALGPLDGAARADEAPARQLIGLWYARRHFGPEVKGALAIEKSGATWTADIAGRTVTVQAEKDQLSFEVPDNQGAFRGRVLPDGGLGGHWVQPRTVAGGAPFATPVRLERRAPGRWRGDVVPLDDAMTFYLRVSLGEGGKVAAFLRNPERNAARFFNVQEVTLDAGAVKLLGRRGKDGPVGELLGGRYDAEGGTLSLYLPWAGGTFDFHRATSSSEAGFFPRMRVPFGYTYRPPVAADDGWPVATIEEAGLSREAVNALVKALMETPIDSVEAPDVHGVLIARHGKLVLEEYFHGFHRDEPHDTRSAAKSLTSTLVGAAILKGLPVRLDTPVYEAMSGGGGAPPGLDPRARALKLEHLLTMSSGLDCDDSDPASPGNEDTLQEQSEQPDWYRYTLDLKMLRAPGEKAVYCSVNPNLAGGVLTRATGRPLAELFDELIARPLQFGRYALFTMPLGEAYMGGGARLRPRDFMKLGQVMLDGGRWHGQPVVSAGWAKAATSSLYELRGQHYGYLWWVTGYPYKGRTLRAFYAAGNGGQIVMGIPELDLVIAFYGGNYSQPVAQLAQRVLVPEFILPAVN